MPEYAMTSSSHTINSHRLLIGSPLLAILMFCFAFVILRPQVSSHVQPVASTHPAVSSGAARSPLPDIPYTSQPVLTKLTMDTGSGAAAAASPPVIGVTGLQLSNTGAASLQTARPNHQKAGNDRKKIEVRTQIYPINF